MNERADLSPFTSYPSVLVDFSPLFVRPNLVDPFLGTFRANGSGYITTCFY